MTRKVLAGVPHRSFASSAKPFTRCMDTHDAGGAAVAGVMALIGKSQVSKAVPPEPTETVRNVKADVDEVKQAVKGNRETAV